MTGMTMSRSTIGGQAAWRGTVGVVSTYPPTACGLATFTSNLVRHLSVSPSARAVGVVQVTEAPLPDPRAEVVGQLVTGTPGAVQLAARTLDRFDVAIVQHEYGIFGGPCGEDVLDLLGELHVPAIVVAHTVLSTPSPQQLRVLAAVADSADVMVTMTDVARDRLVGRYGVDPRRVTVIPHGAVVADGRIPLSSGPPRLLTWGLLGPGKGIEYLIDALALLDDLDPAPRLLVAGQTHPKVREQQGEAYRQELQRRADERGVADRVTFDGRYRPAASLRNLIRAADIVCLPYESTEQVTSGVLVDAIACHRPVVASAFPHAVELLDSGAGFVVPPRDPKALAAALRHVLTEPGLARRMALRAAAIAPSMAWGSVAERYLGLAAGLRARRVA